MYKRQGNGNGNGNSGNISDAPRPPEGGLLVLTPPGRNPLEPSSSALPASAYPQIDPPAPMPRVTDLDYEYFNKMKPQELRNYAKENFDGMKFPVGITKNDMIKRILSKSREGKQTVISRYTPGEIPKASVPKKSVLQRAERSRRKRHDTPKVPSPIDSGDL